MRPVSNPPNPWASSEVEWLEEPPAAKLEVFEESARTIIADNDSPDIPFKHSINPYRGCIHGCAYCYARPTHQYLGYGAGTDFDRKIVVKVNAAELLTEAFAKKSWAGDSLMFSGVTDCYQPLEASYKITRACLEVCAAHRNPVFIVTKGALVQRDIDVLQELTRTACAMVFVSIPFAEDAMGRLIEPWASTIPRRFETLRALAKGGVKCGVSVSPIIPGLNEEDIPKVLKRAREAGATRAFMTLLRLPREVLPVFTERIEEALPDRAKHIQSAVMDVRGGSMNNSTFGKRMSGQGARWQAARDLFEITRRALGYEQGEIEVPNTFKRPSRQGSLFE